jgi:hypothetical protein
MKYLESLLFVGDLNMLVEEYVVVDGLEFAGSREMQSRKKSTKKAKEPETKTKKIAKSPKMPKAQKS